MLPYFFAAHKHNYARYGLFFRRSLTWLPSEVEQQFLRGEQILHHMEGLWNGIPSDQFIETTWMKRGKGPSGIIGDTQNPQTVATWSYSQQAVITLTGDLQMMTEETVLQSWCTKKSLMDVSRQMHKIASRSVLRCRSVLTQWILTVILMVLY